MENYTEEVIFQIRKSKSFRFSVCFVDVLSLFASIITVYTISKLYKKQIFNASTTVLLIFDISLVNVHNISYAFLQNWSLYRSFFNKIDDIMFESEECWPHHTTNEFTKVITFLVQFSLILNRISVTINPEKYSKAYYGTLLCIFTLIAGCLFTFQQHSEGPTRGMMTTSCFRESDVVLDLKKEHIGPYITICMFSIFCSLTMIFYVKRTSGKKNFDMMSEYMRKESIISTIAVTIIGTIQLLSYSFYALFLAIFAHLAEKNPSPQDANVIGWLYTGSFNALISPSAVLVFIVWIRKNRKMEIEKLTKSEINHFQQLSNMWK